MLVKLLDQFTIWEFFLFFSNRKIKFLKIKLLPQYEYLCMYVSYAQLKLGALILSVKNKSLLLALFCEKQKTTKNIKITVFNTLLKRQIFIGSTNKKCIISHS